MIESRQLLIECDMYTMLRHTMESLWNYGQKQMKINHRFCIYMKLVA